MRTASIIFLFMVLVLGQTHAQQYDWTTVYRGSYSETVVSVDADSDGNVIFLGSFLTDVDADPTEDTLQFFTSTNESFFISKLDEDGQFQWSRQLGSADDRVKGSGLAIDSQGNIYVIGEFHDTVDFDLGTGVYEMVSDGPAIIPGGWGPPPQYLTDLFILAMDPNGEFLWAKELDGTSNYNQFYSMAVTADDRLVVMGACRDTIYYDGPNGDIGIGPGSNFEAFVASYDIDGTFIWGEVIGGFADSADHTHYLSPEGLAVDTVGNVYVCGQFFGSVDFDPSSDTNYISSIDNFDAFVFSLDAAGGFRWAKRIGGISYEYAHSLAVDDAGQNVIVSGSFRKDTDFDPGPDTLLITSTTTNYSDAYILSLDLNGNHQWVNVFTGNRSKEVYDAAIDQDGNLFIAGVFGGQMDIDPGSEELIFSASQNDLFFGRFKLDGELIWADEINYGAVGYLGNSLALTPEGHIYLGGSYRYSADLALGPEEDTFAPQSNGSYDIFVQRLGHCSVQLPELDVLACDPYVSPSGDHVWDETGTYHDVLYRGYGCDTLVTVNVAYFGINPSVSLNLTEMTLTCTEEGESYQWLDCQTGQEIQGAEGQVYPLSQNGSYAVVVNQNGCSDTTTCLSVNGLGLEDLDTGSMITYPNPATSTLRIKLPDGNLRATQTRLYDMTGRLVMQQPYNPMVDVSALDTGSYILVVETEQGRFRNVIQKE